ncbi:3-hydroxyacyl-ACP dehydratase FabZ [Adlercreutzia sp. ZJ154]|uniref:3-hydroxyacyl-ACP dehydratase FabZ n=1 Tax=Adlercreutzia sp. ZJ154 TaxID=2709790 RepID=UPI0013EB2E4A|nr:3-hydroxyacyl-ACP dehydratase FabZ [Adlercreutzia sp. ZJ154]
MANVEFPCSKEGVLQLLPHRDPFVWVDRIDICEPGEYILAELDVRPDLPLFEGHFPGYPIFPGVLVMEALAQAACCCLMANQDATVKVGYLAGIDKARFREPVLPGDTIELEARILQASNKFCKAQVKARKGNALVAEAIQRYFFATPDEKEDIIENAENSTSAAKASDATPIILP